MLIRISQSSMSVFSFLGRARNTVYERSLLCCIVKRKNYCHMESKRVELNKEIRFLIGKEASDLHKILLYRNEMILLKKERRLSFFS